MKSRTLLAVAVAATFSASAFAGGAKHHSVEVMTPSSVSESAPWLTGQPHLGGWTAPDAMSLAMSHELAGDQLVGASAGTSGFGAVGSEPFYVVETTEYWLIGEQPSELGVGTSSSLGGSGSVGFDSSSGMESNRLLDSSSALSNEIVVYTPTAEMIFESVGEQTPLLSEHYLVTGPLSSPDSTFLVLAIGPTAEDMALLESLKEDFFVLTPVYDEG